MEIKVLQKSKKIEQVKVNIIEKDKETYLSLLINTITLNSNNNNLLFFLFPTSLSNCGLTISITIILL